MASTLRQNEHFCGDWSNVAEGHLLLQHLRLHRQLLAGTIVEARMEVVSARSFSSNVIQDALLGRKYTIRQYQALKSFTTPNYPLQTSFRYLTENSSGNGSGQQQSDDNQGQGNQQSNGNDSNDNGATCLSSLDYHGIAALVVSLTFAMY